MKRKKTLVKDINKMFPPYSKNYPVAFIVDDEVKVTSESFAKETVSTDNGSEDFEVKVVDYYGEWRGGYPWVSPKLEEYLKVNGFWYEWDHPGAIVIHKV